MYNNDEQKIMGQSIPRRSTLIFTYATTYLSYIHMHVKNVFVVRNILHILLCRCTESFSLILYPSKRGFCRSKAVQKSRVLCLRFSSRNYSFFMSIEPR